MLRRLHRLALVLCSLSALGLVLATGPALASNAAVGLSDASRDALDVPRWLYVATGGAAIGASALLASFATDRGLVASVHEWGGALDGVPFGLLRTVGAVVGLLALAVVALRGFTGPAIPTVNAAVLLVFVGGRAGLTMLAALVGNPWPALNPWRTVASVLPNGFRDYPARFGRWPAVAGLLVLVWLETTTSVTDRPSSLATLVVVYSALTTLGAVVFGPDDWFDNADPVSVFLRAYARVAPLAREGGRLTVRLPGMRLVERYGTDDPHDSDVALAVVLVWELTFSGFVTTTVGGDAVRAVVGVGLPPLLVYAALFLGGFAVFLGAFRLAARVAVRRYPTGRDADSLARRFAPSLFAIAGGYLLAHYLAFFLSLSPSLAAAVSSPLSPPANPLVLSLPAWVGTLGIVAILVGHVLAVWVSHSTAYELFPSRVQAIRIQYPFVAVMVGYTVLSLWLVSLPTAPPPFV
jgi:hypothetical protein